MLVIINVKHKGLCDDKIIIVTGMSEQLKLSDLVFVAPPRFMALLYYIYYTCNTF